MIDLAWYVEEERDPDVAGTPRPIFVTWHFLRGALRREWTVWVGLATAGAMLGLAALVVMPPPATATTTILLAHPSDTEAEAAMATDVTLLRTRAVATSVIDDLGLGITPETFQASVAPEQLTSQILEITVKAPSDAAAVTWADTLVAKYLDFRSSQLKSLTAGRIAGYKARIAATEPLVAAFTRQYNELIAQGPSGQSRASEALSERTRLTSQISTMQRAIEDASLETDASISSTHVIDSARIVPHPAKRTAVLYGASGLIVGGALGVGLVLLRALTSERLRRRQEVALALGVPVRVSVSSKGPAEGRATSVWQRLGRVVRHRPWRGDDLEKLVHGLESAIVPATGWPRAQSTSSRKSRTRKSVAIAALDNDAAAAVVIDMLAIRLRGLGKSVFVVDLSASGALARRIGSEADVDMEASGQASVYRPAGVPGLARGPIGTAHGAISDLPPSDPFRAAWDVSDVVLALVQVDPDLVVMNLRTWVGQVVPLVTAGRMSAEHLRTVSEIIRAAGLDLPFAMMLGVDQADSSLGAPREPELSATGGRQR